MGLDLAAAVDSVAERALPVPWLVGWSFGTDVILKPETWGQWSERFSCQPAFAVSLESDLEAWRKLSPTRGAHSGVG